MKTKSILLVALFTAIHMLSFAQEFTQTVRGVVTDKDTKQTIIGAHIVIVDSDPFQGASTNEKGEFVISNVAVGRISIKVTALGYEPQFLPNLMVESAKETVLQIQTTEAYEMLDQVVVTDKKAHGIQINEMAMVSAKTVTVEETGRYAGSLNDPARSVAAFAGVVGDAEGNNDIVVRGNSPRGILWRLEGVEIPNPNHFANEGSTGGPVNTLNASMLANSDFYSGAFAPEYGNALSGVFDTRFRTGNNQKSERSFSVGVLGTDVTFEGPFSKSYGGSYLVNYRYSTLELMDRAGILDFGGIPKYQDASFKINLPTKKYGNFSIFGLGGNSSINQTNEDLEGEIIGNNEVRAALGVVGVNHHYLVGNKSYFHSYISVSGTHNQNIEESKDETSQQFYDRYSQDFSQRTTRLSTSFHHKFNRKNTLQTGVIYSFMNYHMDSKLNTDNTTPEPWVDAEGKTLMIQGFTTWKYRASPALTFVSGMHYTQLALNKNNSIEPRLGAKLQLNKKEFVSLGFGMHSKVESISVYMANVEDHKETYANKNLELTKSVHLVAGFGHNFNSNLSFKSELYYQHLYDVPVENDLNSTFSMLNQSSSYINTPLVSKGTGTNYGLELTMERYFHQQFYYMLTASFYQSKYTDLSNTQWNSRFNANYASNIVMGKEFNLKSDKKNKTLAVNVRASLIGGNRYTPIDLEKSILEEKTVLDHSKSFEARNEALFYANLGITYRINGKKVTQEVKLDIQNVTNNQATVGRYYNPTNQKIEEYYQLSMIPNLMYILKF